MNDTGNLNRRDFLKLLTLFAVTNLGIPRFEVKPARMPVKSTVGSDPPNILILLFDTFSAAHLSFFGYPRETTPNLARFAEKAVVYHRHYSAGNYTVPGTASLLTGTYPWSHRGLHYYGTARDEYSDRNLFSHLRDRYYTSAFTHNPFVMGLLDQFQGHLDQITPAKDLALLSQPVTEDLFPKDFSMSFWGERVIRASGTDLPASLFLSFLGKDFDSFTPEELKDQYGSLYPRGLPNNSVGLFFLLEHTIDWIQNHVTSLPMPFLGYFHLLPPHEPYMTRQEYIGLFDDGWAPPSKPVLAFPQGREEKFLYQRRRHYDEYIAFVDAEFGRLHDSLERAGLFENTIFVLTSDHGQLFEREIHGHVTSTLYNPLIHIPLLISQPGQKNRQDIFTPTSSIDLLPTLAQLAGHPIPDWCEGHILPGFDPAVEMDRMIYSVEAKRNPKLAPLTVGTFAMIAGRYKLIYYLGYPGKHDQVEFYDLENDPEEREDLSSTRSKMMLEMKAELLALLDEQNQSLEGATQ